MNADLMQNYEREIINNVLHMCLNWGYAYNDSDMKENKLIAEFMELPKVPCNIGTEDGHFNEGYKHPKVDVPIIPSGMQYKYSWDWLMPVVIKCFDDLNFKDFQNSDDLNFKLNDALLETNIESLYKAVVEFIKEYNNETNK